MTSYYECTVDPGGQRTGIVLALCTPQGIVPVDGTVVHRTSAEVDTNAAGGPLYARRVIAAIYALLERHALDPDRDVIMDVETLTVPTPMPQWIKPGDNGRQVKTTTVRMAVWRATLGAHDVLGAVAAVFPDAHLVPPGGNGDVDAPADLRGRRPKHWTLSEATSRKDEVDAWGTLISGRKKKGLTTSLVPSERTPVAIASALQAKGVGALISATRAAWPAADDPEFVARLALEAALVRDRETPAASLLPRLVAAACERCAA